MTKNLIIGAALAATLGGSVYAHGDKEHEDLRHWEIASADPDRIFLTFLEIAPRHGLSLGEQLESKASTPTLK